MAGTVETVLWEEGSGGSVGIRGGDGESEGEGGAGLDSELAALGGGAEPLTSTRQSTRTLILQGSPSLCAHDE